MTTWAPSQNKDRLIGMVISMLKIRRPLGRLIFNTGIAIPGKTVFLIETPPWRTDAYVMTDLYCDAILYIASGGLYNWRTSDDELII